MSLRTVWTRGGEAIVDERMVVVHEQTFGSLSRSVVQSFHQVHLVTQCAHEGGNMRGGGGHRCELLLAPSERESPIADGGDSQFVGESQSAFVEHQVDQRDVKLRALYNLPHF